MSSAEAKLIELGIELPLAPSPAGNYLPYRITGSQLYLAGVISSDSEGVITGAVGEMATVEEGYEAARACAIGALAVMKKAVGSLDNIKQIVFMSGFVNGVSGFPDSPKVINGASDLFAAVFGEAGLHARAAVTVAGLPLNATVEIQVVAELA